MAQTDRFLKSYYHQISVWLPCSLKEKKQIIRSIQSNIQQYLQSHPNATIDELEKHFGSPKTIASSYLECTDSNELLKQIRIRRIIKRTVLAVAAVMILFWGGIICSAAITEWKFSHGYMTIETTQNPR